MSNNKRLKPLSRFMTLSGSKAETKAIIKQVIPILRDLVQAEPEEVNPPEQEIYELRSLDAESEIYAFINKEMNAEVYLVVTLDEDDYYTISVFEKVDKDAGAYVPIDALEMEGIQWKDVKYRIKGTLPEYAWKILSGKFLKSYDFSGNPLEFMSSQFDHFEQCSVDEAYSTMAFPSLIEDSKDLPEGTSSHRLFDTVVFRYDLGEGYYSHILFISNGTSWKVFEECDVRGDHIVYTSMPENRQKSEKKSGVPESTTQANQASVTPISEPQQKASEQGKSQSQSTQAGSKVQTGATTAPQTQR